MAKKDSGLSFEGRSVASTRIKVRGGAVEAGPAVLAVGERRWIVSPVEVIDVSFPERDGALAREHKLALSEPTFVTAEVAEDAVAATEEAATGQMRLLSLEGESRRAVRRFLAALEGLYGDVGGDDATDLPVIAGDASAALTLALSLNPDEVGDAGLYLERVEEALELAGAHLVRAVTWVRRRQDENAAAVLAEAREVAARQAVEAQRAAAVHDDPSDTPGAQAHEGRHLEAVPDGHGGTVAKPSSGRQRVALSNLINALGDAEQAAYVAWCEEYGIPVAPVDMNRDQADRVLAHLNARKQEQA